MLERVKYMQLLPNLEICTKQKQEWPFLVLIHSSFLFFKEYQFLMINVACYQRDLILRPITTVPHQPMWLDGILTWVHVLTNMFYLKNKIYCIWCNTLFPLFLRPFGILHWICVKCAGTVKSLKYAQTSASENIICTYICILYI